MREREIYKHLNRPNEKTLNAAIKRLCGEQIGSGLYRDVYELKADKKYVVKVERDPSTFVFANVAEWNNWMMHRYWIKVAPFLAPCIAINETGRILIQQRAITISDDDNLVFPKKIPSVFTDTKYANYGYIKKQFVCIDYSFLVNTSFFFKKAKWWGDKD